MKNLTLYKIQNMHSKYFFLMLLVLSNLNAQITVTNLNASGSGSLYDAISQIATTGGTINFDPSLSGEISISTSFPTITSEITINGNGKYITEIDFNFASRMFIVSGTGSLTINNFGLKRAGNNSTGGLFYVNNTTGGITANDVRIYLNKSISFVSSKGTLVINNSIIEANGPLGGSYFFRSDWGNTPEGCPLNASFENKTIIKNSTISNNTAPMFWTERYVELENNIIKDNLAGTFGSFKGVNSYVFRNNTFSNSGSLNFSSWISTSTGSWDSKTLCSDHFLIDGNTFIGNGKINIPNYYGPSTTISNNSFDKSSISEYVNYESSRPPTFDSNSFTIFVNSSDGDDSTGDGSNSSPFKTFHKAYTQSSDGDRIKIVGIIDWENSDETGDVINQGYVLNKDLTIQMG